MFSGLDGLGESGDGGMGMSGLGCRYLSVPEKSCLEMVPEYLDV